jgi:predicted enzyme related to lactoylglutathione lyase
VEDVARSLAFYEALGFARWHTIPAEAPFEMGMVGAGGVRLMFWERTRMMPSIPQLEVVEPGRGGPLLQLVEVVGIDDLYARVRALGVTVLQQIATDASGMRQFKIQDCDGWRMLFSERI